MVKKNRFLVSFHHFLIAFALIMKGIDKISHHPVIGGMILSFGIIILIYFIYSLLDKHNHKHLDLLIHLFEAMASLFTAYIFYKEGSKYLHYVFILAAIGFFIAIYVSHFRGQKQIQK